LSVEAGAAAVLVLALSGWPFGCRRPDWLGLVKVHEARFHRLFEFNAMES
jgi:hypothetical protein